MENIKLKMQKNRERERERERWRIKSETHNPFVWHCSDPHWKLPQRSFGKQITRKLKHKIERIREK